ncbi:hypothetical protein ACQY0O_000451 [Thecaphora frezii]
MDATMLVPTASEGKLPGFSIPTLTATFKDGTTVEYQIFIAPFVWHSIVVAYRGLSATQHRVGNGPRKVFKGPCARRQQRH